MSANPIPDPSQQPITAADPRVQQILDMIRAKAGTQAPLDTTATPSQAMIPQQPIPQVPTQLGGPTLAQQATPQDAGPPPPPANLLPMPGQQPQLPPPPQANVVPPSQPGPIKSFLQHLVSGLGTATYAGSQAALQHLGLPTDYEKQQNAAKLGIQQQAANDNSQYRQSLTDLTQGKSAQLDAQNAPFTFGNDPSVPAQLRGQTFPTIVANGLLKVLAQNQGKTDTADINAGGRTDAAQIGADSRERLATAQLGVRQAIADRNYGLAAQRLSLAGGNQNLRQLEYRMRAYGTGANGQPLPGVEFTADGTPVGTATQTNVRPTVNARNAGERADTMQDLATRIRGALNDPEIRNGLGPLSGRINDIKGQAGVLDGPMAELRNDLVSYGAFQAGLHPVRGIGGLQYFEKVMGGLGQTPEQLLAKLSSNDATARSVISVAHGTPPKPPSAPTGNMIFAVDPQGVRHQAPAGTPLPPGWKAQ